VRWIAAAFTAAAILYLPALFAVFRGHGPTASGQAIAFYGLLALGIASIAAHVALSRERRGRVLALGGLTVLTTAAAGVGVLFLLLAYGCGGDGGHHATPAAWAGGAAIYLAGGTWGLRRATRGIWVVPVALLVGGLWLVIVTTAVTGSTGACLS
jgi:hypothetical protein